MKAKFIFSGIVGLALILGSCGTSNSVVSNGLIQKRKYNKGFFMKQNGQFKTAKADSKEENTLVAAPEVAENSLIKTVERPAVAKAQIQNEATAEVRNDLYASADLSIAPTVENNQPMAGYTTECFTETTNSSNSRKEVRKELRAEVKKWRKQENGSSAMDGFTVLLIILAILIPPLAVLLYEGATGRFWIDLILALLGWGLAYWLLGPTIAFLGGLLAIIYALLIVLEAI